MRKKNMILFDRRQFLKSAAACSLVGLNLTEAIPGYPVAAPKPCNCINILLHGLFFLEFDNQDNLLYAVAPKVRHHEGGYLMRDQGQERPRKVHGIQNLRDLKPG